jgi:hypothetical protein
MIRRAIHTALLVAIFYAAISLLAYNLRHPELTQMQVLSKAKQAITWSD